MLVLLLMVVLQQVQIGRDLVQVEPMRRLKQAGQ